MALITEDLRIPPVSELFPSTRRWRKVKPHGTSAAYRRHFRRDEPMCEDCRAWHRNDMRRLRHPVSFGFSEMPDVPRFGADDLEAWNGEL